MYIFLYTTTISSQVTYADKIDGGSSDKAITYNISQKQVYKINLKKLKHSIYLRIVANPLATESFKEGETGPFPKNTSKRARVTLPDSIVASTLDVSPSNETHT